MGNHVGNYVGNHVGNIVRASPEMSRINPVFTTGFAGFPTTQNFSQLPPLPADKDDNLGWANSTFQLPVPTPQTAARAQSGGSLIGSQCWGGFSQQFCDAFERSGIASHSDF